LDPRVDLLGQILANPGNFHGAWDGGGDTSKASAQRCLQRVVVAGKVRNAQLVQRSSRYQVGNAL
jgi:hypothetical protein